MEETGDEKSQFEAIERFMNSSPDSDFIRSTGVTLLDVTTYKYATQADTLIPTVANSLNPLRWRSPRKRKINDLYKVNALIEPGSMCLVLGKPDSGSSAFLRLVSGHSRKQLKKIDGALLFDGVDREIAFDQCHSSFIYSSEDDDHFPFLTVKQTVEFAVASKTPRNCGVSRKEIIESTTNSLIRLFGLSQAMHTIVGNDYIKGISGGERKRVSLMECLATRASVLSFDNSTKGLDSSTALGYLKSVKTLTHLSNSTVLININQASERIYQLFDTVCIFHEKKQLYFGPAKDAVKYFEDMGFYRHPSVTSPDFLASIVQSDFAQIRDGYEMLVPRTSDEFYDCWIKSATYKMLIENIQQYNSSHAGDLNKFKPNSDYALNFVDQLILCCKRGIANTLGNKAYAYSQLFSAVVQSLVIGSLFYNIPESTIGSYSRGSLIFFSLLYFAFIALAEIIKSFLSRSVIEKQKRYCFYRASANFLSEIITDIPLKLVIVLLFSLIIYFLAHLRYEAGKFFVFVLFLWLVTMNLTSLFQTVAIISPTSSIGTAIGGILLLAIGMYATYVIQLRTMHPWFKWIAYINPVYYGFEAMISSELNKMILDCSDTLIPSGSGYENITGDYQICGWYGATLGNDFVRGEAYLESQYGYSYSHVWRNLGILFGFWCFFVSVGVIASEFLHYRGRSEGDINKTFSLKLSSMSTQRSHEDVEAQNQNAILSKFAYFENSSAETVNAVASEVLAWQNVDYAIPVKGGEERNLLSNISGFLKPGTLTALMGASGAGKTTLLNTLSNRNDVGVVTGNILIGGECDLKDMERKIGYVQQQDLHLAELTVRESLIFAARLRQSYDVPDHKKLEYVEQILDRLDMLSYADEMIGGTNKGVGIGMARRKKVSIALELVSKPSLALFLDEPTSGFDSEDALSIVKLLRSMAEAGHAIFCSIHQPSAVLFNEFDNLLLLNRHGKTVYFGEVAKVLSYFESHDTPVCEISENPAEFVVTQISDATIEWDNIWERSTENKELKTAIQRIFHSSIETKNSSHIEPSYFYQLKTVLGRTFTQFYRDPVYIFAEFLLNLVGGLFISFTFWDIGNSITSLQNSLFVVFMVLVISSPLIHQVQDHAAHARNIYDAREMKSKTFHWSILLLSQLLVELPYAIAASTISFCCFYFCLQRDNSAHIAGTFFLSYCILFQAYYISFGLWLYYATDKLIVSSILVAFLFSFTVSFCGVMQPSSLMPGFWLFMYRVSPYTYLVELFSTLILHDLEISCTTMEAAIFRPYAEGETCGEYAAEFVENNGGYILAPESLFLCTYCKYKNGDEFLADEEMSYDHVWRNFGIVIAFILFNIFAMFLSYYLFTVKKTLRKFRRWNLKRSLYNQYK